MTIFSIIIPVYNAADYLGSCIQSIVNQDFSDFELILIDDGSVDGSLKVCQSWQAKDERIRVHHQKKNKGQGAARNVGLRDAKGQYVLFIDADDAIAEDTLAQNFQILNNNPDIECLQFPIYRKYGTEKAYLKKGKEQFFQAEDGIRDADVTGVQTCALPIFKSLLTFSLKAVSLISAKSLDLIVKILIVKPKG